MRRVLFVMLVLVVLPLALFAQDPAAAPSAAPAPWWQLLLANESIWNVVGTVIVALLAWLPAKGWLNGKVGQSIDAGVNQVYSEVVKPLRDKAIVAAKKPEKITAEQAKLLRTQAIDGAKQAGGIIVKLAMSMLSRPVLDMMVERAVGKAKLLNSGEAK